MFVAGAVLAVAGVACGGGSDSSSAATATPQTDETAVALPTPAGSADNPQTIAAKRIATLDAYSYTVSIQGVSGSLAQLGALDPSAQGGRITFQIGGAFAGPDKAIQSMKIGPFTTSETIIGDEKWLTAAGRTQGPMPAAEGEAAKLSLASELWDDSGIVETFGLFVCLGDLVLVNEVQTLTCRMAPEVYKAARSKLKGGFSSPGAKTIDRVFLEIALSDEGYPIRLRFGVVGSDQRDAPYELGVEMNLLRLNKPIEIKPPQ